MIDRTSGSRYSIEKLWPMKSEYHFVLLYVINSLLEEP